METKQITVEGRVYNVHEILASDFDSMQNVDFAEKMKILHTKCCDISVEDYNKLTLKERSLITEAINEVNGWKKQAEPEWDETTGTLVDDSKKKV